MIGMTK